MSVTLCNRTEQSSLKTLADSRLVEELATHDDRPDANTSLRCFTFPPPSTLSADPCAQREMGFVLWGT